MLLRCTVSMLFYSVENATSCSHHPVSLSRLSSHGGKCGRRGPARASHLIARRKLRGASRAPPPRVRDVHSIRLLFYFALLLSSYASKIFYNAQFRAEILLIHFSLSFCRNHFVTYRNSKVTSQPLNASSFSCF